MDIEKINKLLANYPRFRQTQVDKAIFQDLVSSWSEITVLPKELKAILEKEASLEIPCAQILAGKTTTKARLTLQDGLAIETVLMRYKKRNTICVSSQVGCQMDCLFCATAKMGFKRNLKPGEIINQVLFFARLLKKNQEKINNLVFMGMGEPFFNLENVFTSLEILNNPQMFNLGSRHISVSTCGVIAGIKKLAQNPLQVNLAISLHAPNDNLRQKLMPKAGKFLIKDILVAVDDYIAKTNRKVMFEYLMLAGINDNPQQALELSRLLKKPLYMINLIPYNPTGKFKASEADTINKFCQILLAGGVRATQRYTFGQEINSACGQLFVS